MDNKTDYIKPTKENPIFKCYNDYYGYIEDSMYKEWEIHKGNVWSVGSTFAIDLSKAILKLHDYIKEHQESIEPNSKFTIVIGWLFKQIWRSKRKKMLFYFHETG